MRPVDAMTHVEVEAELTRSGVVLTTTARALALKWLRHDCQEPVYQECLAEIEKLLDRWDEANQASLSYMGYGLTIRTLIEDTRIKAQGGHESDEQGADPDNDILANAQEAGEDRCWYCQQPFPEACKGNAAIEAGCGCHSVDDDTFGRLAGKAYLLLAHQGKPVASPEWHALCLEDPGFCKMSVCLFNDIAIFLHSKHLIEPTEEGWFPCYDLLEKVSEIIEAPTLDTPTLKRYGSRFLVMCQEDGFWFQVDLCRHQIECGSYDADGTCKMYAYPRRMAFGDIDPIYPSHEDAKIILQAWLEMGR